MLLFVLAHIGGVLTMASPCILPVVPFVFSRAFTIQFLAPGVQAYAFTFG